VLAGYYIYMYISIHWFYLLICLCFFNIILDLLIAHITYVHFLSTAFFKHQLRIATYTAVFVDALLAEIKTIWPLWIHREWARTQSLTGKRRPWKQKAQNVLTCFNGSVCCPLELERLCDLRVAQTMSNMLGKDCFKRIKGLDWVVC